MIIGVPKEIMHDENRVSATPEVCARYIAQGHTVLVEHDAGKAHSSMTINTRPARNWCSPRRNR